MKTRSQEKFVKDYETRIRKYRDEYYHQIAKIGLTNNKLNSNDIFYYMLPFLCAALIIVVGNATITSIIFGTFLVIIVNFGIYLYKKINHIEMNNYAKEIRKLGYKSIADYEAALKEIITGEDGIYHKELVNILKKYGLDEETANIIIDTNGNKNFIWYDDEEDELCIVNGQLNIKPKLNCLKLGYIRYYRFDKITNHAILKTDIDEYTYREDAMNIFDKLIKEKKFDGHKKIDIEEYIDDFELYMHHLKSTTTTDSSNNKLVKDNVQSNILISIVFIILFTGLIYIFPKNQLLFEIAIILCELILNKFVNEYISIEVISTNNDDEYINYLNNNQECIERFRELKLALGIPFDAMPVYSPEGACYLVWVANGYFHVFLNLIYFNVVYIVIKTKDVEYYKVNKNECLVKIPDKTLHFTKDAADTFAKILPNKDYDWIKGIINNK